MKMKRFFTSCFGLGRLPWAPGTWGCLPVAVLFGVLKYIGASGSAVTAFMSLMMIFGAVVCLKFARSVADGLGSSDPREIVADEWAGQAIVFLGMASIEPELAFVTMLFGFGLFRLFDILKPWPIRKLEKLPGGVGILADDLAAGLVAMVVMLVAWKLDVLAWLGRYFLISNELNVFTATVLGAVQGLTEFLPVSSSGHLVLFEHIFNFQMDADKNPSMLVFDLMVHVGTVVSVLIVMRKEIIVWLKRLTQFSRYGRTLKQVYMRSPAVRILMLAMLADLVTGVVGILFKKQFEGARQYLWIVVAGWVATGIFLAITDRRKKGKLGLRQFGAWEAVAVGLAQAVAILPGVSRSGATICAAILLGLKRRWAVEFSFLVGIPLILIASLKEFAERFTAVKESGTSMLAVFAGSAAACIVGVFALKLLIASARRAKLKGFAYYCFALAALVSVYVLLS